MKYFPSSLNNNIQSKITLLTNDYLNNNNKQRYQAYSILLRLLLKR